MTEARRRLDIGDFVILLYIAAFVRQYLWVVGDNRAAWPLTVAATALVWRLHWRTKEASAGRAPRFFWLTVALPLLFFYALRAALPDLSWDVLDYRLINAELALRGWPMRAGDFFPVRFPFNPAPDVVMGLGRYLLGYRLGTLVNFSVLVWTGMLLERLLRGFVKGEKARCLCVLVLILTEHALFEVNNYMVDLLSLPLLLEAARLDAETEGDGARGRRDFARAGLYLGAALAFKLTNLAFAVPVVLLFAYRLIRKEARFDFKAAIYGLACVVLPLAPYTLYILWQTGNPVFPLYNWIFKSHYWPVIDTRTERWGPIVDDPRFKSMKAWEILLWPLLHPLRVENTAGDLGPHWGRVSIAFVASIVGLAWRGADRRIRFLSFVAVLGSVLWSAASGMLRYATFVELVGGAVTIYFVVTLYGCAKSSTRPWALLSRVTAVTLAFILVVQSAAACAHGYRFEWGSRPTVFQLPENHLRDARQLLSDRSARDYLSDEERALFEGVGAWVESGPMTSGLQILFRPDAPQLCVYMPEFFTTEESRRKFADALRRAEGKRLATLCMADEFKSCTEHIGRAGLGVGKISAVSLPFYSHRARFATSYFMEVLPTKMGGGRGFEITAARGPLAEGDFRAALSWARTPPATLRAGERRALYVSVGNAGRSKWPSLGGAGQNFRLFLGNHWLDASGRVVTNDDGRSSLPYDLAPGEEIELLLTVTAPPAAGDYTLELDLLQEGVSWFGLKGSDTLRWKLKVED